MANYIASDTDLTSVANAIRTKGGTSSSLVFPSGFVTAIQNIPSGGSATLITKSITANGTYNASSDSADGYSQVSVAVPVLPVVSGTFTPGNTEANSVKSITVPYTGNGYPVACVIRPTAGSYKSGTSIYTSTQQKAVVMYAMSKANAGEAPDYSTTTSEKNQGTVVAMYKNSSSDATNIAPSGSKNSFIFTSYNASGNAAQNIVRFKSKTEMTVYVGGGSNYGFLAGTEYTYEIVYSA